MLNFIYWIVIGGLAGWIAEKIMKSDMGLIGNIILGIVGSVVLNAVLQQFPNFQPSDTWYVQLIVAIIGACILIFGWRLIRGRR